MKKFNLKKATLGHALITQDGDDASFVSYLPFANKGHRLIVLVNGHVWRRQSNGKHCDTCSGSVYPAIFLK